MTRAVEAELRAEVATEDTRQERQRATDAQQRCDAAVASAAAQQQAAHTREQQLRAQVQVRAERGDEAVKVCCTAA